MEVKTRNIVVTDNMKDNKLHAILDYSGPKPWILTSLDIALDEAEFRCLG